MQREPPVDQTRLWLRYSSEDLRAASYVLQAKPPFVEDALFHCQQAVEKAFKAFLTWHDHPFRRTHSIEEVGEQCLLIDNSLRSVVDAAAPLTGYAWKFRYPRRAGGTVRGRGSTGVGCRADGARLYP